MSTSSSGGGRSGAGWLVGVASAATLAWVVAVGSLAGFQVTQLPPPGATTGEIVRLSLGKSEASIRQMVGVFGWLDTPASSGAYLLWYLGTGFVVVTGLAWAAGRRRAVLLAVVALTIAAPVLLEASQARTIGFPGRAATPCRWPSGCRSLPPSPAGRSSRRSGVGS